MSQILFHGIDISDFKKIISDVLDEKLKLTQKAEVTEKKTVFLNRFEVAEFLKISLPTLNNWSKEGIVQSHRIGNRVLYKLDEIEEAVKKVKNLKFRRA